MTWRTSFKLLGFLVALGALLLIAYQLDFLKHVSAVAGARRLIASGAITGDKTSTDVTSTVGPSKANQIPILGRLREIATTIVNRTAAQSVDDAKRMLLCGTGWQEKYAKLHQEILDSKRPPRFLVFHCGGVGFGCGGYGNRLGAIASLFYLAVLTNRAFLINWSSNISIKNYFVPKNIKWNYPKENLRGLQTRRHFWGRGFHKRITLDTVRFPGITSGNFRRWFVKTNFNQYFDHQVEMVSSQWYFAQAMRYNKYYIQAARTFGMKLKGHRYSPLGCVFDFLFSKTANLKRILKQARRSLHFNPRLPRIGIHFRSGDAVFTRKKKLKPKSFDVVDGFFKCAKKLEHLFVKAVPELNPAEIIWYLATDSEEIKTYASRIFPKKIRYLRIKLEHISKAEPSRGGMEGVLLDNLLLSETDVLIISNSSFSQAALGIGFHSLKVSTYGLQCRY